MVTTCEARITAPNVVPTAKIAVISGSEAASREPNRNSRMTSAASMPAPSAPPPPRSPAPRGRRRRRARPAARRPRTPGRCRSRRARRRDRCRRDVVELHLREADGAVLGDRAVRPRRLRGDHAVELADRGDQVGDRGGAPRRRRPPGSRSSRCRPPGRASAPRRRRAAPATRCRAASCRCGSRCRPTASRPVIATSATSQRPIAHQWWRCDQPASLVIRVSRGSVRGAAGCRSSWSPRECVDASICRQPT